MVKDHEGHEFTSMRAMLSYWHIDHKTYKNRLAKNWSLKEVLTTPPKSKGVKCTDHLGNQFESIAMMCKHWDIPVSIYKNRVNKADWSTEKALTTPINQGIAYTDHLGNTFKSIREMCNYWNISEPVVHARLKNKWSIKDTLTTPVNSALSRKPTTYMDHKNNKFKSKKEMCDYWNISVKLFYSRTSHGWSIEKALTTPASKRITTYKDHKNNEFPTMKDMCTYWGISCKTFNDRLSKGWSLKDILETPIQTSKQITDHLGNNFNAITDMCKYWNITPNIYRNRIRKGLSLKDALTLPVASISSTIYVDPIGNKFKSISDMAKCWNRDISQCHKYIKKGTPLSQVLGIVPMPSELNRIADSNYYLLKTEDYGEVVVTFETLEKYYISKFDQSKLDKSYMINDNEELDKEAI